MKPEPQSPIQASYVGERDSTAWTITVASQETGLEVAEPRLEPDTDTIRTCLKQQLNHYAKTVR